jgi:hypothetical protein
MSRACRMEQPEAVGTAEIVRKQIATGDAT